MIKRTVGVILAVGAMTASLWANESVRFADVTKETGLAGLLGNWQLAHGAAWGDANGDGRLDLYIGAFADRPIWKTEAAPIPNQLFLNTPKGFVLSDEKAIRMDGEYARTSMAMFVDLDNDGDLELFAGNHATKPHQYQTRVYENTGGGHFRDVTPTAASWPNPLGIRNAAAVDFDRDGLLDLALTDGSYANWRNNGGQLIIMRNKGNWEFERASKRFGFPPDGTFGMGLAIGDVNNDGYLDFFVADSCRLFVSTPGPVYRDCDASSFPRPTWREAHVCGADFGDLNGDDLLDLVTTVHGEPGRISIYLNNGLKDGMPSFRNISEQVGVGPNFPLRTTIGTAMKAGQVAICDMNNDGLNDVFLAAVYADDKLGRQPVVLRNLGVKQGVPSFTKLPSDRFLAYYAVGPIGDYDSDGRIDICLPNWHEPETVPFVLYRNATEGGHWLKVRVVGTGKGFNRMGIGSTVRAYQAGKLGRPGALIARRDISIGNGYSSGEEAVAHLGLGAAASCDIEILWQGKRLIRKDVKVDQDLRISFPGD